MFHRRGHQTILCQVMIGSQMGTRKFKNDSGRALSNTYYGIPGYLWYFWEVSSCALEWRRSSSRTSLLQSLSRMGEDFVCVEHAVSKCRVKNGVIGKQYGHSLASCRNPIHAICGMSLCPNDGEEEERYGSFRLCSTCFEKRNSIASQQPAPRSDANPSNSSSHGSSHGSNDSDAEEENKASGYVCIPHYLVPHGINSFTLNVQGAPQCDRLTKLTVHSTSMPHSRIEEATRKSKQHKRQPFRLSTSESAVKKRRYRSSRANRTRENETRRARYNKNKGKVHKRYCKMFVDKNRNDNILMPFVEDFPSRNNTQFFSDRHVQTVQVRHTFEIEAWNHSWIPQKDGARTSAGDQYRIIHSISGVKTVARH
ncbi:hypothetical protein FGB62_209g01 [Gracilaria domingensis]|nr:hypothetical protein FGB62_209g01 [Gracilaria domingensis]